MLNYVFNMFLNPLNERRNMVKWPHYLAQGVNPSECGPAMAGMLVNAHYGVRVSVRQMRAKIPQPLFWNIRDVERAARDEGVPVNNHTIVMTLPDFEKVIAGCRYAVIHVDGFHFVIVRKLGANYQLIDPLNGICTTTPAKVFKRLSYNYIVTI